ncbi:DUF1428 domain-containing protein [Methyloligella solikamskensis]|uniref:DUF1428 domain-containing protein n=1 Tax=Methyloligella solikamskensis TaxID=1177756 RepID=A0ABW3JCH7_9HYPH
MQYVDGFVLAVPTAKLDEYFAMAEKASEVWLDHGALEYKEAVGEDLEVKGDMPFTSFATMANATPDETVVFAWIVYESRAHRDEVNAKVMADERLKEMCESGEMPLDVARMAYGGFEIKVAA